MGNDFYNQRETQLQLSQLEARRKTEVARSLLGRIQAISRPNQLCVFNMLFKLGK